MASLASEGEVKWSCDSNTLGKLQSIHWVIPRDHRPISTSFFLVRNVWMHCSKELHAHVCILLRLRSIIYPVDQILAESMWAQEEENDGNVCCQLCVHYSGLYLSVALAT